MYIKNEEAMKKWAFKFAHSLKQPAVVSLKGDLGAGKTRIVQWIGQAMGSSDRISSPTFDLIHIYKSERGPIRHLDLYRLEDQEEIEELDYEEAFFPESGFTFIEWADKAKDYLPENMIEVSIKKGQDQEREVEVR